MAPRNLRLETLSNFTGGLNLRADPFELQPNESPDMLNVDPDPRGGVELRPGIQPLPIQVQTHNVLTEQESTFEGGIAGAGGASNCTLAQSAVFAWQGTKSLLMTQTVTGTSFFFTGMDAAHGGNYPCTAGKTYSASTYIRSSISRSITFGIRWYNGGGGMISDSTQILATTTTGFVRHSITATAPAGAVSMNVVVIVAAGVVGDLHYFDGFMLNEGVNVTSFQASGLDRYSLDAPVIDMQRFEKLGQYEHLLVATAYTFYVIKFEEGTVSVGGAPHWKAYAIIAYGNCGGFEFRNGNNSTKAYLVHELANASWDGAAFAVVANAFNDNYTSPTYNNMPKARYGAVHGGSAWVAHTSEGGVAHPNRIRFSHPNSAGDWRSTDFIDIEPGFGGDFITALVPFKDRLLVFKRQSVFAVVGDNPENFAVIPISRSVGCVSPTAVVATDDAVYFFAWPLGVMRLDGKGLTWQFSRLATLVDRGNIAFDKPNQIFMGWSALRNRVWVSVPWRALSTDASPTYPTRTYVLDPSLGKEGAWTAYDLTPQIMYNFTFTGLGGYLFSSYAGTGRIYLLDWPGEPAPFDVLTPGVAQHINSYYATRWIDVKSPAILKRWKAPEFVLRGGNSYDVEVDVYTDYDTQSKRKTMSLHVPIDNSVMNWGDNWGENWGPPPTVTTNNRVIKGSTIGRARAVALKIIGPTTNNYWGLNALVAKYIPIPPRS